MNPTWEQWQKGVEAEKANPERPEGYTMPEEVE